MNTINKSLIPQIVMGDKVYCTDEAGWVWNFPRLSQKQTEQPCLP